MFHNYHIASLRLYIIWWVEKLETEHHWVEELDAPAPQTFMERLPRTKEWLILHLIQQRKWKDMQAAQVEVVNLKKRMGESNAKARVVGRRNVQPREDVWTI